MTTFEKSLWQELVCKGLIKRHGLAYLWLNDTFLPGVPKPDNNPALKNIMDGVRKSFGVIICQDTARRGLQEFVESRGWN